VPPDLRRRAVAIGITGALVLRAVAITAGVALIHSVKAAVRRLPRRLLVREDGRLYGTPLLLVVVAIVVADIAFAVDSIPAAFAVTHEAVVIWTANAFALLGLGSLLGLVDILVRRFRYLGKTIALILAFVGIKILAADLVRISDLASLAVIAPSSPAASSLRLPQIA
jgi:predicted tellurium resistance membrane protein TerC